MQTSYERQLIGLAREHSNGKVIVLLNTDASMEIGELKQDPDADAIPLQLQFTRVRPADYAVDGGKKSVRGAEGHCGAQKSNLTKWLS